MCILNVMVNIPTVKLLDIKCRSDAQELQFDQTKRSTNLKRFMAYVIYSTDSRKKIVKNILFTTHKNSFWSFLFCELEEGVCS